MSETWIDTPSCWVDRLSAWLPDAATLASVGVVGMAGAALAGRAVGDVGAVVSLLPVASGAGGAATRAETGGLAGHPELTGTPVPVTLAGAGAALAAGVHLVVLPQSPVAQAEQAGAVSGGRLAASVPAVSGQTVVGAEAGPGTVPLATDRAAARGVVEAPAGLVGLGAVAPLARVESGQHVGAPVSRPGLGLATRATLAVSAVAASPGGPELGTRAQGTAWPVLAVGPGRGEGRWACGQVSPSTATRAGGALAVASASALSLPRQVVASENVSLDSSLTTGLRFASALEPELM